MTERIYKGYWHLPDSEKEVAGVLTIDSTGKSKLEVFGALHLDSQIPDFFDTAKKDVIWGRCYDPQNKMTDITLLNCYPAPTFNFDSTFPLVRYNCTYALIGIFVTSLTDSVFFKANIYIPALQPWCPSDALTLVHTDSGVSANMAYSKDPAIAASAQLDDGATLSVIKSGSYSADQTKAIFERETFLRIQKGSLSVPEILKMTRSFEDFLSIAVLSPVEHRKIILFSEQEYQMVSDEEKYYFPIELVGHQSIEDRARVTESYDYLFSLQDIANDFESIYKKFFSDKNILQIKNNFIASLERKRVFTSNDFLVVAQALDGFSIRYRKEGEYLKQLIALRGEFKEVKKVTLTDEDLIATRDSRDYYTHILNPGKKKHVLDGRDLFLLTKKLRVLLICCFLNYFGMNNAQIDDLLSRSNSHHLLTQ